MTSFTINEANQSQIPALQLLINLGYTYLPQDQLERERSYKSSSILLESILREQLKKLNRITYKGSSYLFSEENIQTAIQRLKTYENAGLQKNNEAMYEFITLGTSLKQIIESTTRSFDLIYIDWQNIDRNVFHVASEVIIDHTRSAEQSRLDLILYVNGIPFVVIECKSPLVEIEKGIDQVIAYQSKMPELFMYTQMLLSINKNMGQYGTVGTPKNFWSPWKELEEQDLILSKIINQPLSNELKSDLFKDTFQRYRQYFQDLEDQGNRLVTEQDRILYALCRPDRLLEMVHKFTIFDNGFKKIARYQQYFVIKSSLKQIQQREIHGNRKGGVIWQTQGSGKSLTMVMLARNLVLEPSINSPRIVLVTDREDLDQQLGNTFKSCGLEVEHATSGKGLLELLVETKATIISTLIHKFDTALNNRQYNNLSTEIFVLVDEAHRSQYQSMNAKMQTILPNACYIGFTGTPLIKSEKKNTFGKFGKIIEPYYGIKEAVEDKAVVPLLYEGRMVNIQQTENEIDLWFDQYTSKLSEKQKQQIKQRYASISVLNQRQRVICRQALDISEHYRENWKGTGFKAQIVVESRDTAILMKKYLDEIGDVQSEVIMSQPDLRYENDENDEHQAEAAEEITSSVREFWQDMMKEYGTEKKYNLEIINNFKQAATPEVLIVIDKLLTGFDAPKNTVLYLCRKLKDHTLLQAIARVNRLAEGKEFGYIIDYANVFDHLHQTLSDYAEFSQFDPNDINDIWKDIRTQIKRLPQLHQHLCVLFHKIHNQKDLEAFELYLADEGIRKDFYQRLLDFSKCLNIALSSKYFLRETSQDEQQKYRDDLKRFLNLKQSVSLRYADVEQFQINDAKIKKMLDVHIQADSVIRLNEPFNIFDQKRFDEIKNANADSSDPSTSSKASKSASADMMAHAMKKTFIEKMEEDPAVFEKFSKMIQDVIDSFHNQYISDVEYLEKVCEIRDTYVFQKYDELPPEINQHDNAKAYYGVILSYLSEHFGQEDQMKEKMKKASVEIALKIDAILIENMIVDFWENERAQKKVMSEIDDFFYDVIIPDYGIGLVEEDMDQITQKVMKVAEHRIG